MRHEILSTLRIPTFSIGVMVEVLQRAHIDPSLAFHRIGLERGSRLPSSGFISAKAEINFERVFRALTAGRRDLWVEVGRLHRLPGYGLFGLALSTAPTLRQWVKTAGMAPDLCFSFGDYRPVERKGQLCGIEFCFDAVPDDLREMTFYRDLGALLAVFEEIWRGPTRGFCIDLAASNEGAKVLRAVSRLKVRAECPRTMLTWPAAITDDPLPYGNEYLHRYYCEQCESLLDRSAAFDLPERIKRVVRLHPAVHSSVNIVARRLNLSVRTLQRRLGKQGIAFRSVLAQARTEIAQTLLQQPTMSIAQVASHLGYSDRASFDLAFHRWTGRSPRQFRDEHRTI